MMKWFDFLSVLLFLLFPRVPLRVLPYALGRDFFIIPLRTHEHSQIRIEEIFFPRLTFAYTFLSLHPPDGLVLLLLLQTVLLLPHVEIPRIIGVARGVSPNTKKPFICTFFHFADSPPSSRRWV